MILRRHIPNFCSGIDPKQYEVNNTEELLALDVVKSWKFDVVKSWKFVDVFRKFHQYSQSKHGNGYLLIAEYEEEEEHKWWVIGYLSEKPALPEFKGD